MRRFLGLGFLSLMAVAAVTAGAQAAQKTVLLPFDLVLQKKEEDFFIGAGKPSPAEQARLKMINEELARILSNDGVHQLIDTGPISKEIEDAMPFVDCNGCEVDLAKKLNGEVLYTGLRYPAQHAHHGNRRGERQTDPRRQRRHPGQYR